MRVSISQRMNGLRRCGNRCGAAPLATAPHGLRSGAGTRTVPCARQPSENAGARWEVSRDERRDGEAPALRSRPYPEADAVSAMSLAGPGYGIFGSCPGSVSL